MKELYPAFTSSNVTIAITASDEYVPFLGVLLESIKENSTKENNYDVIVLTTGISDINKKSLGEIVNQENFSLRYFDVKEQMSGYSLYTNYHISTMTYCRLAIINGLSKYDKVIYSDADVVFNHDIADLYNIDLSGEKNDYLIAGVIDSVLAGFHNLRHRTYNEEIEEKRKESVEYSLKYLNYADNEDVIQYFNAGIVLMNLKALRCEISSRELFEIAASRQWRWFDQDILNKVCHGRVKFLEASWNYMCHDMSRDAHSIEQMATEDFYQRYLEARLHPKALHYCGKCLPCFAPKVDNARYFWRYARNTMFYEELLYTMMENVEEKPLPGWEGVDKDIYARFRFPWESVLPGARIILYGGGVVGKIFIRQISMNPYCHIMAVVDKKPEATGIRECPVINITELLGIDEKKYDFILIAIENQGVAENIKKTLVFSGIKEEKIKWIDPSCGC